MVCLNEWRTTIIISKKHELGYYPHWVTSLWQLLLPRLAEELVLDEDREGKHDDSLDEHGAEVLSHHVPAEGVLEAVLPW